MVTWKGAGAERTGNVDGAVLAEKDFARLYVPASAKALLSLVTVVRSYPILFYPIFTCYISPHCTERELVNRVLYSSVF